MRYSLSLIAEIGGGRLIGCNREVDAVVTDSRSFMVQPSALFVAHKGQTFELIDIAPSGWYHIMTAYPDAYITNKPRYTEIG